MFASYIRIIDFELVETERMLTLKVEELTLYLIEMKKEMDALKSELEELKSGK